MQLGKMQSKLKKMASPVTRRGNSVRIVQVSIMA